MCRSVQRMPALLNIFSAADIGGRQIDKVDEKKESDRNGGIGEDMGIGDIGTHNVMKAIRGINTEGQRDQEGNAEIDE